MESRDSYGNIRPEVISPVSREAWESVFRKDQGAVVSQSLAWRDALIASGHYRDMSVWYRFPDGHEVVLPLLRRRLHPTAVSTLSSWPAIGGIGGPISSGGRITGPQAALILSELASRSSLGIRMILRHDADRNWLTEANAFRIGRYGHYLLDISNGFDDVWKRKFRPRVRTAVRKAERSSLDVEADTSGRLAGSFNDLYEKSIRQRAAANQDPVWLTRFRLNLVSPTPPRMVSSVTRCFGEGCKIWLARLGGEPVAALIVLHSGNYVRAWRAALDRTIGGSLGASELLYRLSVEDACRAGYQLYDLTGAVPGSSLAAFKERLGATLHFTHRLWIDRPVLKAYQATQQISFGVAKRALRLT